MKSTSYNRPAGKSHTFRGCKIGDLSPYRTKEVGAPAVSYALSAADFASIPSATSALLILGASLADGTAATNSASSAHRPL